MTAQSGSVSVSQSQRAQTQVYSQKESAVPDSSRVAHGASLPNLANQHEESLDNPSESCQVCSCAPQGPLEHSSFLSEEHSEREESVEEVYQTQDQDKRASLLFAVAAVAVDRQAQLGRLVEEQGQRKQESLPLATAAVVLVTV